jgi:hypothetical protein
VPQNLPEIRDGQDEDGDAWEQRATILARENERNRSAPATPVREDMPDLGALGLGKGNEGGIVSSKNTDDNIQEAIRLHEAGELVKATRMFGRLADPNGENNALSQVLYGLALRWFSPSYFVKVVTSMDLRTISAAVSLERVDTIIMNPILQKSSK